MADTPLRNARVRAGTSVALELAVGLDGGRARGHTAQVAAARTAPKKILGDIHISAASLCATAP